MSQYLMYYTYVISKCKSSKVVFITSIIFRHSCYNELYIQHFKSFDKNQINNTVAKPFFFLNCVFV